jgi:hypothetical protein
MLNGTAKNTAVSISGIGGFGYSEHVRQVEVQLLTTLQENRVTSNVCPSISEQVQHLLSAA